MSAAEYFEQDVAMLKLPPHSIEAEQAVLGGLIIDAYLLDDVAEIISAEDFFRPNHRIIYQAILKASEAGDGVDILTVAQLIPDLAAIGGPAYLAEIASNTPSVVNLKGYAKAVKTKSQERAIIAAANAIADAGYDPEMSIDDKIGMAQKLVMSIGETSAEKQLYGNEALKAWVDALDTRHNSDSSFGIATGLKDLDTRLHGFQPSDLVLLAGRPAMGKSTLAFQFAANAAVNDTGVMIFSLEMSRNQIYDKVGSCLGQIPLDNIRKGTMREDDWPKLSATVRMLKDKPLYVDDRGGLHINQILATARRMHRQNPLGLIVVDYIQLVRGEGQNRTSEVGSISRALKALAKELNCTVLALSQLNRSVDQRANSRPINSDLRDSGELEQDADIILFVYRDEVYHPDGPSAGVTEIICSKFRNGETGTSYAATRLECSRFDNLMRPYAEPENYSNHKPKSSGLDY